MIRSFADRRTLNIFNGVRESERLKGDREGRHSIRISRGWRICFVWRDGDAFEVELNNHYD